MMGALAIMIYAATTPPRINPVHDCGRSIESCFCAEEYIDRLPATEIDDARDWRPWPNDPQDERDWMEWHMAKRARERGVE